MTEAIFFKSDFTVPEGISAFGRFEYEIRGMADSDLFFDLIHIKPGLYLSVYKQSYLQIPKIAFEVNNAPVSFSFLISGSCRHRIHGMAPGKTMEFDMVSGTNAVTSLPDISGDMVPGPDSPPLLGVDLKIDRRLLYAYLEERLGCLLPEFKNIFNPRKQLYVTFPLCRDMMATALEVIHPPAYTGTSLTLFYESRALSLLALQLEQITGRHHPFCHGQTDAAGVNRSDLERLYHARKVLVADLRNPPTIAALARKCGINEFKLKKGFKQTFNTTIFSYLQQVKMDKAWHLLKEENRSVTEAATEVGYTNISHFSAAFRKQYHINPGALKKSRTLAHIPLPREPETIY